MSEYSHIEDSELMALVRGGTTEAFSALYRRHEQWARSYASRLAASPDDAADIVADVFARMLQLLVDRRGPVGEFAPYLTRMLRNAAYDRGRTSRRLLLTDRAEVLDRPEELADPVVGAQDRALASRALAALPPRWQHVLWLTCVAEQPVGVVAATLGMRPTAVTSLAFRARAGLRRAFVQAHVPESASERCREVGDELGSYLCGEARASVRALVEWHVARCSRCRDLVAELREVAQQVGERTGRRGRTLPGREAA